MTKDLYIYLMAVIVVSFIINLFIYTECFGVC